MYRNRSFRLLFSLFIVLLPLTTVSPSARAGMCDVVLGKAQEQYKLAADSVRMAEEFAKANDLPMQVLDVGPGQMGRKRLFVAIDHTNQALMEKYYETFQKDKGGAGDVDAVLPLFFQRERDANHYLFGGLRFGTEYNTKLYRNQTYDSTMRQVLQNQPGIAGFEYIVPIAKSQRANLKKFLTKPQDRAPCKSTNCIAWISQIELTKTAPGVAEADRGFLADYLGISRTIEHRELSRRLMNAANENLAVVFVHVTGKAGYKEFKSKLEESLPPAPKKLYAEIIKGFIDVNQGAVDAVAKIKDGSKVFIPIAAGASPEAVDALFRRAPDTRKGFDVHVLVNGISERVFADGIERGDGQVRLHALFLGGNLRKLYSEGRVNYVPGNLADFAALVKEGHPNFAYDAIVVRVSPARRGVHSLGPNNDHIMTILEARPDIKIIAEINDKIPFTEGKNRIPADRITASFEGRAGLGGPAKVPLTDVEINIGKNLAKLVPSESTIQIGIGNVFDGLPGALKSARRKNLNIHTEMFGDAMKEMVEAGLVNKAKTGFAYGTEELYAWLDGNKQVVFERTEVVNNPANVQAIEGFHAINTALQVSLEGEINATMGPGGQRISSPGGQVEFMTGAARASKGKAIIAIRSTAKGGELSTITLDLYPGPITTNHESVTHVVTEYGVAELRGYSVSERAIRLINIAHPKFREQLFGQAVERGLVQEADREKISLGE